MTSAIQICYLAPMPRAARNCPGGMVFHVLNRANARLTIFRTAADYAAFEAILADAVRRVGMRVLAYCLMPNHFHLILWPRRDRDVSEFMRWVTVTHTQRWHAHHHTAGRGHLYQGRFKSFPIEGDQHLLMVWRYVERNALRAGLGKRARDWRWGSLWLRTLGGVGLRAMLHADAPTDLPRDWEAIVDQPQTDAELDAVRTSIKRGRPFGNAAWVTRVAKRLDLGSTLRPRGRPRKPANQRGKSSRKGS